jgi:hypothetical protein
LSFGRRRAGYKIKRERMNTTLSYGIMNFLKQKKINKRKALILDLWTLAHSYLAMIMDEKPRKTQVKVRKKTYQMLEVTAWGIKLISSVQYWIGTRVFQGHLKKWAE